MSAHVRMARARVVATAARDALAAALAELERLDRERETERDDALDAALAADDDGMADRAEQLFDAQAGLTTAVDVVASALLELDGDVLPGLRSGERAVRRAMPHAVAS